MKRPAVLFVCLGNICRSPLAEAAFRREALTHGLDAIADSAGTGGWHAGEPPHPRARDVALRHGVDIASLRARQIHRDDFTRFTHVLALDRSNLADLERIRPKGSEAHLSLLNAFVPGKSGQDVLDPYYGEMPEFETAWRDVSEAAIHLVRHLLNGIR